MHLTPDSQQNPMMNFVRRASATSMHILQNSLNLLRKTSGVVADEDLNNNVKDETIYSFSVLDSKGKTVSLDKYHGKVVLIVNVASQCAFTPSNLDQLKTLHENYHKQGLRILAFPCNQFGNQEPGTAKEIRDFFSKNAIKFDVFAKVNVNGKDAHPLFLFLQNKLHGSLTNDIKWNFTKFLINRNGIPVDRYAPTTEPLDIEDDIVYQLNKNNSNNKKLK